MSGTYVRAYAAPALLLLRRRLLRTCMFIHAERAHSPVCEQASLLCLRVSDNRRGRRHCHAFLCLRPPPHNTTTTTTTTTIIPRYHPHADQWKGTNLLIVASEDFVDIQVQHVGPLEPE
jgi:hypothetical protein